MVCKFCLTLLLLLSCCRPMWKSFFPPFAFSFRSTKRKIQSTKGHAFKAGDSVLSSPWLVEVSRPLKPMALILISFWMLRPPCLHPPIAFWDPNHRLPPPGNSLGIWSLMGELRPLLLTQSLTGLGVWELNSRRNKK